MQKKPYLLRRHRNLACSARLSPRNKFATYQTILHSNFRSQFRSVLHFGIRFSRRPPLKTVKQVQLSIAHWQKLWWRTRPQNDWP